MNVSGALVIAMVLSYLLYNFQYGITRLFEGYWPHVRVLQALRSWRVEPHRHRWKYLGPVPSNDSSRVINHVTPEQLACYPSPLHPDEFIPTRIGNILRASELYAYDRYGIDSPTIWTRLRPLLADDVVAPLAGSGTTKNFMLLMSILAITFTIFWWIILAVFKSRWDLFLLCSLGLATCVDMLSKCCAKYTRFHRVLVLDIKSIGNQMAIVLAIPANDWLDYLTKTHNATIVLARQVN